MSKSYKVSSEERNAIYKIRDALIFGVNSLTPEEINVLGKNLDQILSNMDEDFSSNRGNETDTDIKNSAITLGMLCQGINDLSDVALRKKQGVCLESKRRMAKAGGITQYATNLQKEGIRAINKLGFSKNDIKIMEFD